MNDAAKIVVRRHKAYVDAAKGCMKIAHRSIKERDYQHAADMLKCATRHLESAEVVDRILKDIESAR